MDASLLNSVNAVLSTVFDPRLGPPPGKDLVSAKMVESVEIKDGALCVGIALPYAAMGEASVWQDRIGRALAGLAPQGKVKVSIAVKVKPERYPQP